jgi:hypothetical protein
MREHDTDSNSPTFDISSLPSVHEHDWRTTNPLDIKSTAGETVNLESATIEDPYSDEYFAKEKEVSPPRAVANTNTNTSPQQQQQQAAIPMSKPNTSTVHFENSSAPQEAIHINAMFQTNGSSSNNHTNSAQQGATNSNSNDAANTSQQLQSYVPNKYSAHHDPSMPDWEGVTIAERTMADISTLSPPPDDYYNPYVSPHPPVAMIAAASPGTPWEELEESDAERADWKNPTYKENSTLGTSNNESALQPRDRRLIWGLIGLVGMLVVVVSVIVPVSIKAVNNNGGSKLVGQENVLVTAPPTSMPVLGSGDGPCVGPECKPQDDDKVVTTDDFVDVDGGVVPADPTNTTNTTASPSLADTMAPEVDWETSPPIDQGNNGRETKVPTPSPITLEPTLSTITTEPPSIAAIVESTPEPTISTPEPTPEPTSKPSTSSPTPSPTSSLLSSNLGETPQAWLTAHNTRRQYYHETVYGTSYIPLVWSESLASEAQAWAEEQNDGSGCSAGTQDRDDIGQTGYAYWNTRDDGMDAPEDVMTWWVDEEEGLDYDENKKFTQAVWRGSKYLGCGSSIAEFEESGRTAYCRIYVCNYIRKGELCSYSNICPWICVFTRVCLIVESLQGIATWTNITIGRNQC